MPLREKTLGKRTHVLQNFKCSLIAEITEGIPAEGHRVMHLNLRTLRLPSLSRTHVISNKSR